MAGTILYFPAQLKKTPRKSKPKKDKAEPQPKSTALEWIMNGYVFPGKVRP